MLIAQTRRSKLDPQNPYKIEHMKTSSIIPVLLWEDGKERQKSQKDED